MNIASKYQQMILHEFIQSQGELSSSEIQSSCKISRKTLTAEINEINTLLVNHGARIEPVMGKGYTVLVFDAAQYQIFKSQYLLNYQRNRYLYIEKNYLTYLILFELFLSDSFISIDQLAEKFHYSRSVILQNVKQVKEILKKYGCTLINKPNHGMLLDASEWNYRICLLFLDKIAMRVGTLVLGISNKFAHELDKDRYNMSRITELLSKELRACNVRISQNDFVKICLYTILTQTRKEYSHRVTFTPERHERVSKTKYPMVSRRIAASLCQEGWEIADEDIEGIAILLLAYSHPEASDTLISADMQQCHALSKEFAAYLGEQYNGFSDHFDETFYDEFAALLYELRQKIFFEIPSDEEVGFAVKPDGAFTADLCRDLGCFFYNRCGIMLQESDLLNSYHVFSSALLRNFYKRAQFSVAIISRYGVYFANNVAQRLLQIYGNDICRVEVYEFLEAEDVDLSVYDLLITDMEQKKYNFVPIPVIYLDFYRDPKESKQLREFFSIIIRAKVEDFIQDKYILRDCTCKNKQDVFAEFARRYIPKKLHKKFVDACIRNDNFFTFERSNRIAFISVDSEFYSQSNIVIMACQSAFVWTNEPIEVAIFFNRKIQPYKAIKYLNTLLICLMHAPVNVVQELPKMNAAALADYIVGKATDKTETRISK